MTLQLDPQAKQLLSFVQQQTSRIDDKLEAQITQKATETGGVLNIAQLEKLLVQAMPEHKEKITKLGEQCLCHHSDGKNGAFLTQMVGLHRIQKDRSAVYHQPQFTQPARDPLFAKFIMAKDADVLLVFNASKFDDGGRPLLMKIVARESMKDKIPDLSNYHTLTKTPDVQYVANDAAFVEIQDENEAEFAFGDAIAQVSLNAKGKELSRNGGVGPTNQRVTNYFSGMNVGGTIVPNLNAPVGVAPTHEAGIHLDNAHVQRFEDRIQLSLAAASTFPAGGWLETAASHLETKLTVQPGYLLEPGTKGNVSFAGAAVATHVPADDFSFNGSDSGAATVNSGNYHSTSLGQFLRQNVRQSTQSDSSGGHDAQTVDTPAFQLVFAHPERVQVGGIALDPLGDRMVKKADFAAAQVAVHVEPLASDPEKDGQEIVIDLAKGFLTGKDGESLAGWRVEAGYRGGASQNNEWIGTKALTSKAGGTPAECLKLALPNAPEALAAGTNLELRVYNAEGVPAQRILIPLTELPWG